MLIERLTKLALLGSSWVLYLLLVLSVLSIATMVERWVYFARRSADFEDLRAKLVSRLEETNVEAIDKLLASHPSLQARIVREAIHWLHGGASAMEDAVNAELSRVRAELERGTNLLGTLGNNAPFIGLFGTVLGVIIAFHSLGQAGGNAGAMGGVMGGIAEALVATGVGLFVALPAVVAYNLIQKKIGQIETDAVALVKLISAYAKSNSKLLDRARSFAEGRGQRGQASEASDEERRQPQLKLVGDAPASDASIAAVEGNG